MSTQWIIAAVVAAAFLLVAVAVVWLLWRSSRRAAERMLAGAEREATTIVARAETEGAQLLKDAEIAARERLIAARSEFERETREHRVELAGLERSLDERGTEVGRREAEVANREKAAEESTADLERRSAAVAERERELAAAVDEQRARLEQIAGLTAEQAKGELIHALENEARMDATNLVRRIEEETMERSREKARRIIALAIERVAADHVAESTVSVVDLPSDDMKGRIIGREGRNIRAFEQATGVDLIVDDTPEAVILSCFEPVRRETARIALERLVADGRIHPARIEEVVAKVQDEVDEKLLADGEAAALELAIPDLPPELLRHLGRLQFRTSYGQSVLSHSKEVAWLAAHMAGELGCDAAVAKRAALLHDIGKAVDREQEGTHLELGREMLRRHGERPEIVHAMECHHGDYEPQTVEAILVTAADALSAARPGARREVLQNYVKRLERLEGVAEEFSGVEKAYAIQAGRELRVVVQAERISDDEATWLARDVAKKIESELTYPGMIKVTIIRETRSVEYAR